LQIKTKNVSCHTADFKPVKQEVNDTLIFPPLVLEQAKKHYAAKGQKVTYSLVIPTALLPLAQLLTNFLILFF